MRRSERWPPPSATAATTRRGRCSRRVPRASSWSRRATRLASGRSSYPVRSSCAARPSRATTRRWSPRSTGTACSARTARGPHGVGAWNTRVEQWLRAAEGTDWLPDRYPGQPLIQTSNDYGLRLWNGDTGAVLGGDERQALFDDGAGGRVLSLARLSDVEVAHALTVHRSQGSEFREVTVVLPDPDSRLLSRELLYTAVTRAVDVVRVVGTEESVREAVRRHARRASGLADRLAAQQPTVT
ncbi:ATP-binding domain-containing protein [Nocardioides sp. TF02-7]|uniref:ATP-binding domain-containing protein n=1 Tax=Nocardioides sp. TF02-7 TaxID=2917724 RepID=UPI0031F4BBBD